MIAHLQYVDSNIAEGYNIYSLNGNRVVIGWHDFDRIREIEKQTTRFGHMRSFAWGKEIDTAMLDKVGIEWRA